MAIWRCTVIGVLIVLLLLVLTPSVLAQEEEEEDGGKLQGTPRTVAQVLCITSIVIAILIPLGTIVFIIVIRIRMNVLTKRMLKEFGEKGMEPFPEYRGRV